MRAIIIAAAMLAAAGCGEDMATNPTDPPCATITIANNAVSPNAVTVSPGCRVTFVNNDSRNHDMASDPHPEHTTCLELNQVGHLEAGQRRETGNLNTVRRCGFHDHNDPNNRGLQGTITTQ